MTPIRNGIVNYKKHYRIRLALVDLDGSPRGEQPGRISYLLLWWGSLDYWAIPPSPKDADVTVYLWKKRFKKTGNYLMPQWRCSDGFNDPKMKRFEKYRYEVEKCIDPAPVCGRSIAPSDLNVVASYSLAILLGWLAQGVDRGFVGN